jgi:hypothetical protein
MIQVDSKILLQQKQAKQVEQETNMKQVLSRMQATCSPEQSYDFQWITWHYVPELFVTAAARTSNPACHSDVQINLS